MPRQGLARGKADEKFGMKSGLVDMDQCVIQQPA
jgi:hypothetical protein